MSPNTIIDKVHKLLRLAERAGTPEEAASAAAMAQRLIDEHDLNEALLAYDGATPTEPEEDIRDFAKLGAPLDNDSPNKLIRWKAALASAISRANGCRIWFSAGTIQLVGRPSDADKVRYLYSLVCYETERLVTKDGAGCGRTWKNNYRLGVVDTIIRRLAASKKDFVEGHRAAVTGTALMRIDAALAKVDKRGTDAEEFIAKGELGFNLKTIKLTQGRYIKDARQSGREAGEKINLDNAKGSLGGGAKRLS